MTLSIKLEAHNVLHCHQRRAELWPTCTALSSEEGWVVANTHTHPFNGPFSGTTQVSRYQKGKTNLDLMKQETVSGSGISWAVCKSAPCSRQTTTPAPHHSVFYRPDALPAAQPTASKHWRQSTENLVKFVYVVFETYEWAKKTNMLITILWTPARGEVIQ